MLEFEIELVIEKIKKTCDEKYLCEDDYVLFLKDFLAPFSDLINKVYMKHHDLISQFEHEFAIKIQEFVKNYYQEKLKELKGE